MKNDQYLLVSPEHSSWEERSTSDGANFDLAPQVKTAEPSLQHSNCDKVAVGTVDLLQWHDHNQLLQLVTVTCPKFTAPAVISLEGCWGRN
jgi:hypothetical protein